MRRETFRTPGPVTLVLRVPAGSVEVEAVEGEETFVELEGLNDPGREAVEGATIEHAGDEVRVEVVRERTAGIMLAFRSPRVRARVTCPPGSRLRADVVAAELTARGRFGPVSLNSVSGDVDVHDVGGDLELRTVSGDAVVRRVTGSARLKTVSGDLSVHELGGSADAKTISGDLDLGSVASGSVSVQSVSGDVKIGVAPGAGVWMDLKSLSGDTRSELVPSEGPTGAEASCLEVRAKSVSGDIRLIRA